MINLSEDAKDMFEFTKMFKDIPFEVTGYQHFTDKKTNYSLQNKGRVLNQQNTYLTTARRKG